MEILKPSAAQVKEQLTRIVVSPQFRESQRLQAFLEFVVALTLEGKANQIKESTISAEVFGRADMPDDSIVRSAARRLRTKLAEYYQQAGADDPVQIVTPKGSYVPEIEERRAGTSPPFSEPLAVTRPGIVPPARTDRNRRWFYAAAIVLCATAASLGVWYPRHGFSAPPASHVVNPAAQDLVVKGRFDLQTATTEAVKLAESDFQRAIDADPEYAEAYLELGTAKWAEARARGSIYRTELERNGAAELSRKALQLDPNLPEAHALLAQIAMEYDWDWSGAERELRLALRGTSSAKAELAYAFFLIFHRRFGEADPHLQRSQQLEPFDTSNMLSLAQAYYLEGRFARARDNAQRLLAMHPGLTEAQVEVAGSHIWDGHPETALAALKGITKPSAVLPFYEAMARARAGQREQALRLIRPYEERYPNTGVALQWIAKVYAMVGDEPNTVKWLERSADRREWQALNLAVNPVFAPMEKSHGFLALKKRMGLP